MHGSQRLAPQIDGRCARRAGRDRRRRARGRYQSSSSSTSISKRVEIVGRDVVVAVGVDRQHVRQRCACKLGERVDRSRSARRSARRFAVDDALVAEILDDQQAGVEIGGIDLGRRKPMRAQRLAPWRRRARHSRPDARWRCRACRQRTGGPSGRARRDHQDRALPFAEFSRS